MKKRKEGGKEGEAISGSLELGTEARKAIRVEVANPQTSKSWKFVHEKISVLCKVHGKRQKLKNLKIPRLLLRQILN